MLLSCHPLSSTLAQCSLCRCFSDLNAEFWKLITDHLFSLHLPFILKHIFHFFFQEKVAKALDVKNEAIKGLETAIEQEKKEQWRVEGRSYLFDAKRVSSSSSAVHFHCSLCYIIQVPLKLLTSDKPFSLCGADRASPPDPVTFAIQGVLLFCVLAKR